MEMEDLWLAVYYASSVKKGLQTNPDEICCENSFLEITVNLCLLFYALATSKVILVQVLTYDSAHSW